MALGAAAAAIAWRRRPDGDIVFRDQEADCRGALIVARSAATAVDRMEAQIPGRGPRWAGRDGWRFAWRRRPDHAIVS